MTIRSRFHSVLALAALTFTGCATTTLTSQSPEVWGGVFADSPHRASRYAPRIVPAILDTTWADHGLLLHDLANVPRGTRVGLVLEDGVRVTGRVDSIAPVPETSEHTRYRDAVAAGYTGPKPHEEVRFTTLRGETVHGSFEGWRGSAFWVRSDSATTARLRNPLEIARFEMGDRVVSSDTLLAWASKARVPDLLAIYLRTDAPTGIPSASIPIPFAAVGVWNRVEAPGTQAWNEGNAPSALAPLAGVAIVLVTLIVYTGEMYGID